MTWTKLSDDFGDQLERLDLSRGARMLHVEAYLFANRLGTDGRIARRDVRRFSDAPAEELEELLAATQRDGSPLWTPVDGEEGVWQLDWRDQEEAAVIARRRDEAQARQRRWRNHKAGDHDECSAKHCAHAPRDETRDKTRDETPPRTDPTRPAPKGAGQGREQPSTGDCSVCSRPEAECRARSHVSGHDFTPRAAGVRVVPADSEPREAASR